jgi:hypothetical protein
MYTIKQTLKKNIMINNNIIENAINLENYIENYINTELLYKNINGAIMLKLRKYKYLYPKLITNKLYINNKYIITTFIEFDTLKFYKNQIISGFDLSETNKFEDLILLNKDYNEKIKITAVDLNNSEQYKKKNNIVRILNINYIDNKVNLIVENVNDKYFGHINYFKNNTNINNQIDITPFLGLTNNYKFNILFNKKKETLNINEIIDKLTKLPKKNTFILKFNKDLIEMTETEEDITYNNVEIYLVNTLIEFNNYYLIKTTL